MLDLSTAWNERDTQIRVFYALPSFFQLPSIASTNTYTHAPRPSWYPSTEPTHPLNLPTHLISPTLSRLINPVTHLHTLSMHTFNQHIYPLEKPIHPLNAHTNPSNPDTPQLTYPHNPQIYYLTHSLTHSTQLPMENMQPFSTQTHYITISVILCYSCC